MNTETLILLLGHFSVQLATSAVLILVLINLAFLKRKLVPLDEIFNISKKPMSKEEIVKLDKTYSFPLNIIFLTSLIFFFVSFSAYLYASSADILASKELSDLLYDTDAKKLFFRHVFFLNFLGFSFSLISSIIISSNYYNKFSFVKYSSISDDLLKLISSNQVASDFYCAIASLGRELTVGELCIVNGLLSETEAGQSLNKIDEFKKQSSV